MMPLQKPTALEDRYVTAGGLRLRYIELGDGHPVIFLHGASLGSSADVFARNLPAFAEAGLRAIAYDQPGFGLAEVPTDHSMSVRYRSVTAFADALGLRRYAIVAHSQAGNMAVQLAFEYPDIVSHVVVLGTGSLLPPMKESEEGRGATAQARLERRMANEEPTLADTRKLLESNLFHHDLITEHELALRHARSTGENFRAFVARSEAGEKGNKATGTPLWRRLIELRPPLLMIFGRNDRANAFERATHLKQVYPQLNLHIVPDCKHLVPWDAEQDVARLVIPFLKA
jgi:4,5:9,10-diseco-3-hydroxy-5,9,17-trioxoandrosta-1(10),2-diene-4-oate hydrolase